MGGGCEVYFRNTRTTTQNHKELACLVKKIKQKWDDTHILLLENYHKNKALIPPQPWLMSSKIARSLQLQGTKSITTLIEAT